MNERIPRPRTLPARAPADTGLINHNDRRHTADQAAQPEIWRRMEVEQRWKRPKRVPGRPTLDEDVDHALKHVLGGRRAAEHSPRRGTRQTRRQTPR